MEIKPIYGESVNDSDYTHSSNSLFHFMKKSDYLIAILERKAIVPRYCKEDIHYLKLSLEEKPFEEMAVLQKCFCDIPLHKIADKMKCNVRFEGNGDDFGEERYYSHIDLYGEYAIAFAKSWGERNGIQPVHYINEKSPFCDEMGQSITSAIALDDGICDAIIDSYLSILMYLKPLRGDMPRYNAGKAEIVTKNFHDEHEWRYVPKLEGIIEGQNGFEPLIANPHLLSDSMNSTLNLMSNLICEEQYRGYWLPLEYNDIKYIIVPNSHARLELIDFISKLQIEDIEKYLLISKLMVFEEVGRDL